MSELTEIVPLSWGKISGSMPDPETGIAAFRDIPAIRCDFGYSLSDVKDAIEACRCDGFDEDGFRITVYSDRLEIRLEELGFAVKIPLPEEEDLLDALNETLMVALLTEDYAEDEDVAGASLVLHLQHQI